MIAAGGTTLTLNADGTYQGETGWSSGGGGISSYETEPAYQEGVQSTGHRTIPDVAFDADHGTGVAVYDSYDNTGSGPWQDMGGTSLAAPSWAALVAVADQGRVAEGGTTLDGATQTLPALYSAPSADFHDITIGSNGANDAGTGYDEVTGLGSPVANLLVPDLAFYGMADSLAIAAEPPASATAGTPFSLTVEVQGPDGSLATGASGTLTIAMENNSGGGSLGGTLTATIDQGIATFSNLVIDQAGAGYTLTVSGSGLGSATSSAFNVTPGSTSNLVIAAQPPTTIAAGTGFGLTIDVEDAYGNLETGFSGPVTLSLTGGPSAVTLGGSLQATAIDGVAAFSGLTIDQAGTGYAVTVSASGSPSVTTPSFNVTPAQAAKLAIASQPAASVTAGSRSGLTVDVEDAYGNLETGYGGAVTVALAGKPSGASLGGTASAAASGGVATFSGLTIDQAGSGYMLQAAAAGLTSSDTRAFAVTPAAAAKLVITSGPATSVTAGTPLGLTVDVEDAFGNLVTGYGGEVTVGLSNGPAGTSLGGTLRVAASGGVATFSVLTIDRAGTDDTLQVSAGGLTTADTPAITVTPASASHLVIADAPNASETAGTGFGLSVDVEDAYGNLVSSYGSEVTLGLVGGPTGSSLGGTLSVATSGGVATFSGLTIDRAGSDYMIQAAATGLAPAMTTSLGVTPAAPAQLVITEPPPSAVTAGKGFGLSVSVEDAFGNLETAYDRDVTVGLTGGPANAALGGPSSVPAIGGVATFTGLQLTEAGSGYTVSASGAGLTSAPSAALVVTPAAPAQVVITTPPPAAITAGTSFGLGVEVEDAFGNVATSFDGPVTLDLSGGPAGASLGGSTTVRCQERGGDLLGADPRRERTDLCTPGDGLRPVERRRQRHRRIPRRSDPTGDQHPAAREHHGGESVRPGRDGRGCVRQCR